MALSQDAKNYGNRPRLRGKHMRSGPLADIIREVSSPLQTLEFKVTHADLTAAGTTQTITLPALPTGAEIIKVVCLLSTSFDGVSNSLLVELGVNADADRYGDELQIHEDDGSTIASTRKVWLATSSKGADEIDIEGASTSGLALELKFTQGSGVLSGLTSGEFKVCILYAIMPL